MSVEFLPKVSSFKPSARSLEQAVEVHVQPENANISILKNPNGSYFAKSSAGLSRYGLIQGLAEAGFAPGSMVQNDQGQWSGTVRKLKPST